MARSGTSTRTTPPPRTRGCAVAGAHGSVDCDVCVVGGGIAGCSTALHLAEQGFESCCSSSSASAGAPPDAAARRRCSGVAAGQAKLERLIGAAEARAVWDVSVEALACCADSSRASASTATGSTGYLLTAVKPRQQRELRAEVERAARALRLSRACATCRARSCARSLATSRYLGGLYDTNSGHLHPLNYTLGLARAAAQLGVRIFEGTPRRRFQRRRPLAGARAHRRPARCARATWCCAATSTSGRPPRRSPPRSWRVATYIVATEPLGGARARQLIANNAAVCDMNWVLDYFRRSADQRLLFGGRVNYSGLRSFDAPAATRARMLRVFPQLADVRIEYAWGGDVDITLNRAPHFGRLAPNVYFLQGFSGHGIALTGIAGKLVAEAIAGTAARFDVFARIPHANFPGGAALRRPALVLAML